MIITLARRSLRARLGRSIFTGLAIMAGVAFVESHDLSRLRHFPIPLRLLVASSLIANLLQPFWMLPTLALLGLKARDIMGYTYLVALVLFPLVLVLVTVLAPH